MSLRPIALALLLSAPTAGLAPLPLLAEQAAPQPAQAGAVTLQDLSETLMIQAMLDMLRAEGLDYGLTLQDELFPGASDDRWQGVVELIYDTARMRRQFDEVLARELGDDPAVLAEIDAFFAAPLGQTLLSLEIEARRALLDDAAEEAAEIAVEDMIADADPRLDLLRRFAEVNDLIEANVSGALNANLAFYRGMAAEGAFGGEMTEDQMLADVWGQEADIRAETEAWLFPFLNLAYQPVSDEDLESYIAFSESAAGRRMNAALFAAFDRIFVTISQDLGRAAARQIAGQDI
jgi:hypothetical protein